MAGSGAIEVEGLRELNKAIRRSVDTDLPKRMGAANKSIGALVVSKLQPRPDPAAIGSGAGATVRPAASKREVLLRVGGTHRAGHTPYMRWGKRLGRAIRTQAPPRPYIRGTVDANRKEIDNAYLDAIGRAMSGAFAD